MQYQVLLQNADVDQLRFRLPRSAILKKDFGHR